MRRHCWYRFVFAALAVFCVLCPPRNLTAQESEPAVQERPEQPLAVISVAGIERILQALDFSFEAADRLEASEAVGGFLDRAGELKGIDHNQAFGVMIFLSGLTPEPIGFVPVDKIEDLMKTIELTPLTTKKIDAEHYELKGSGDTTYVRIVGRYAFVSNDEQRLDRVFPDPASMTAPLSKQYDIAAMLNLDSLPEDKKTLLADLLKASADANLQRRDRESEFDHRLRKAFGENHAGLLEQMLREARNVTLGWKLSPQQRQGVLELTLHAYRGTELSKLTEDLQTSRSQFGNFLNGDAPLTFASTWKLDERGKVLLREIVGALESTVPAPAEEAADDDPIQQLFRAARVTIESGSLDVAVRFLGEPKGPFVLVGGLKVTNGPAMAGGLAELCSYWLEIGKDAEADVDKYKGIRFHRVDVGANENDQDRLFGGKPSLYLGVDEKTLWAAVGGDEALPVLYEQIDTLAEPADQAQPGAPLLFVFNLSDWMSLADENAPRGRIGRTAAEAFTPENSTLRVELRSIDNGARLRVELNEGFIRYVGMTFARRFTRE